MTIIIPAHFLGCVFGAVLFKTSCRFMLQADFEPLVYDGGNFFEGLLHETAAECIYVCMVIGLPELLAVNKLSTDLLSVLVLPLMFWRVPYQSSTLNPAALYALWYVEGKDAIPWKLQFEHLIGPLAGSMLGGILCSRIIPDDSNSWRRK
jgi:hypothetical protein